MGLTLLPEWFAFSVFLIAALAVFFGRIGDWLSQRWFTASVLGGLAPHLALAARR